jgi:plasmid maintenance system antidote protein VapI
MPLASYAVGVGRKGDYRKDYAESARAALLSFMATYDPSGKKLTNPEAAKLLKTSAATVSKVASGTQHMQMPMAIELANILGVTVDDLMVRRGRRAQAPEEGLERVLEAVQKLVDTAKDGRSSSGLAPARRGR